MVANQPQTAYDPEHDPLAEERSAMVSEQVEARGITDTRVLAAMRRVPRHEFIPPVLRWAAYQDSALPIGYGQTISQPYIVCWKFGRRPGTTLNGMPDIMRLSTGTNACL